MGFSSSKPWYILHACYLFCLVVLRAYHVDTKHENLNLQMFKAINVLYIKHLFTGLVSFLEK